MGVTFRLIPSGPNNIRCCNYVVWGLWALSTFEQADTANLFMEALNDSRKPGKEPKEPSPSQTI